MAPRVPDQEECEGLLQQWQEEGSSQALSTVSEGLLVDKGVAQSSLALLMDHPGEHDAAAEDKWSSRQLSDLRAAENLEEPFPEVLGEEPLPEVEGPMWAAVPVQTGPQYADCAVLSVGALAAEQWEEDPAVVAWSIAPEPVPQEETPIWPFEGLGQLQSPPVEIPYHGESDNRLSEPGQQVVSDVRTVTAKALLYGALLLHSAFLRLLQWQIQRGVREHFIQPCGLSDEVITAQRGSRTCLKSHS